MWHEPVLAMSQPSLSNNTLAFGRSASPYPPIAGFGFGSSRQDGPVKPTTPPPILRRRRRESTPLDEEPERAGDAMDVVGALTNKRARRDIKGLRGPSATHRASPEAQPDVDTGKMLASLPKDALLSIIDSLMCQHPGLKPVIQSLIPPPSLDAFVSTLSQLERRVLDSVPRGLKLRDEYIWSRVRGAVDDYVTEGRTFINSFVPPAPSASNEDAHAPTTVFSFLSSLTASYVRIEAVLPRSTPAAEVTTYRIAPNDPLSSHLLPALFNAWHTFATRLAHAINSQGRMLSAETVRSWFRTLEELCSAPESAFKEQESPARRACEGVRERLLKEVGWTISLRPRRVMSSSSLRDDSMLADNEEL